MILAGCAGSSGPPQPSPAPVPREIRVTLIHLNDVYEITPTGDGRRGGLARVATLLRDLRGRNPNTFAVLAGDLMSPSALGTARVDGERLQGRQMVAVLNAMGLDFATFGNHEFDLGEDAFRARLGESTFRWLSANVFAAGDDPLPGVTTHAILRVPGAAGDTLRLALFGVTMDRDRADHVRIEEPLAAALREADILGDSADAIVALTHLPRAQDAELAEESSIDLIVGGHDHENWLLRRGPSFTPIAKADANALSVWVHELVWRPGEAVQVSSRLVAITDSIAEEPATARVAGDWVRRAYAGFRESGFDPEHVVARSTVPLDGLESSILVDTTALTHQIAEAMRAEADVDIALFNAGSIRIDDILPPGPISEYDVIRILPFGGPIVEVEMTGALLRRVLAQGLRNRGTGGYLHSAGIERAADGEWRVAGRVLSDDVAYRIAVSDFLISGREQGLDWLNRENPDLRVIEAHRDVRSALIDGLARSFPVSPAGRTPASAQGRDG